LRDFDCFANYLSETGREFFMDRAQLTPPTELPTRPRDGHAHDGSSHRVGETAPAEDLDHDQIDLNVRKPGRGWIVAVVVVVLVTLGILLAVGLLPRLHEHKELMADASAAADAA